jgi:hypothetical protein
MKLRFSRSSLNIIIFVCIILVGWASIDKNRTADVTQFQTIDLPPLAELKEQIWTSHEGIKVTWQARLDTDFQIRIRGQRQASSIPANSTNSNWDSTLVSWQDDYWQWDINLGTDFELGLSKLSQRINDFPSSLKGQPAVIILQGPWSADIARLTSARMIKSLGLKPLEISTPTTIQKTNSQVTNSSYFCPWQPVSAQYWLQDQLSNASLSRADINKKQWRISYWPTLAPIHKDSLYAWKQTFVQQWQLNWQDPATQFDILADLAYYRLPQNYLLQGYWGINALDVKQLENYLSQCQAAEQILHASK